ncbi:STAS domain-containing protein [Amycolatopsis sp. CA-128772]|uniref:STAS domain-containing protein n=1 Tax=Amycolatopsis sp. CA-128772 TaxID=2073159 RepID=UPI000CD31655|nr:STAS domain-containing protein [Amycolatopsis sp. CA-128772]
MDGTITVTRAIVADAVVLTIAGPVDAATSGQLSTLLAEAIGERCPRLVVLDLRPVEFFAAAGIHVVTRLAAGCRFRGIGVRLVLATGTTAHRVVGLAGGDLEVAAFDDLAAALARRE